MTEKELREVRNEFGSDSSASAYYLGGYGAGLNGDPGRRPGAISGKKHNGEIILLPLSRSSLDLPRLYSWQMGYLDSLGDQGFWDILQSEITSLNEEEWWIDLRKKNLNVES